MFTVNNSALLPRIIERTHLKLILRSPGLLIPRLEFFVAVLFGVMSFFWRTKSSPVWWIFLIFALLFGSMSDISFECHREKSMQVNCLIQDSRLFNLIQLAPKYFNNIKEAKLGSEEVTESSEEGGSSTHTEYYLRLMDNNDRLSDSIFRSTDSNRIESIKNQINSFINSQQSSLDASFTTKEIVRILDPVDLLITPLLIFGGFFSMLSIVKLYELYHRIVGHYFVFDKYAQKLEHTVKIFNWSLRSQCYQLSDITEVCLTKKITGTEEGKFSSYTLRLLLNSYQRSGSQKEILLLVRTDFFGNFSIENVSEIQKVISDFLSVNSTNKEMEN